MATIDDVLAFWFGEAPATNAAELGSKMKRWYMGGEIEDAAIRERFAATVERALAGELDAWAETPRGHLALILLLDQMTRSVFRGMPRAFAGDPRAQRLAIEMLEPGTSGELSFEDVGITRRTEGSRGAQVARNSRPAQPERPCTSRRRGRFPREKCGRAGRARTQRVWFTSTTGWLMRPRGPALPLSPWGCCAPFRAVRNLHDTILDAWAGLARAGERTGSSTMSHPGDTVAHEAALAAAICERETGPGPTSADDTTSAERVPFAGFGSERAFRRALRIAQWIDD